MAVQDSSSTALLIGREIEVRTRFDKHWVAGFEVADQRDDVYFLRRRSDRSVLPLPFGPQEIRTRE